MLGTKDCFTLSSCMWLYVYNILQTELIAVLFNLPPPTLTENKISKTTPDITVELIVGRHKGCRLAHETNAHHSFGTWL